MRPAVPKGWFDWVPTMRLGQALLPENRAIRAMKVGIGRDIYAHDRADIDARART